MSTRRTWLAGCGWLTFSGLVRSTLHTQAEEPSGSSTPTPGVTIADLEQQLKSGLRARRQVEFDFIHGVVLLVKANELPIDLVQSTFLWARRHRPYPYPYFERGLRERAARLGLSLDDL